MSNRKGLGRFGSKSVLLIGALALIICSTIGGTLAWMFDKTDPVINTFTVGDIKITLTEPDTEQDDDPDNNSYSFYPDAEISKEAIVTVKAGSEDCWLFVKVEESDNFDDFMEYAMADGWSKVTAQNDGSVIWSRKVSNADSDQTFLVLKDGKVTVKDGVTQAQLDELTEETYPTLKFTAYAVQLSDGSDELTAAQAWAKIQ